MTTIRTIITDALREGGILALGETPEATLADEGLRLFNRLLRSFLGNEMGDAFINYTFGSSTGMNAYGLADNRKDFIQSTYVPSNARLMVNLDIGTTIVLNPNPMDGARLGIIDEAQNFGTYNLTINPNGRRIESATSIVLSTNGTNTEWFYRGDLGQWQKVTDLLIGDESPFPEEFDDFLTTSLALRLNPRLGQVMATETASILQRGRSQFRSRYRQNMEIHSELGLIRLPSIKKYFNYTVPLYRFNRGY